MNDSVLIVAAEASSSLYALRLLEKWKSDGRKVAAFGIGSRDMENAGFERFGKSEDMAVVGIQEVLKHLPLIRDVFNKLLSETEIRKPKFALLLDYPDFNLRLAKQLKKRGVKVIYYISPQVWAWRTGRVKKMKKMIEHMLVLFPFEKPFYTEHGMKVDFVGHPALDELAPPAGESAMKFHRAKFGLTEKDVVLGLMPGSRRSEIAHHLKTQLDAARLVLKSKPTARVMLMVAPTLDNAFIKSAMGEIEFPIQIIKENPLDMISLADVILVASGTATLMVGLLEKPMVIMYRMNALTAWIAKKLVTKTKFFGMVNLIVDRLAVPELFQEKASPENLAKELLRLIDDPVAREKTKADLREMKDRLGSRGATDRVAKVLEGYFA